MRIPETNAENCVTKTLSLRILRPYYSNEVELKIAAQKEKQRKKAEQKYADHPECEKKLRESEKLSQAFYSRLEEEHNILTWNTLGRMFSQLQRQCARTYNQSISKMYLETVIKPKEERTGGIAHYLSKIAYHDANNIFHNAYMALGLRQKVQSGFRIKELLAQKTALPTARSENFPISIIKQDGFSIKTEKNDFIITMPFADHTVDPENKYEPFKWDIKKKRPISLLLITKQRQSKKGWEKDNGTDAEIRRIMNGDIPITWLEIRRGKRIGEKNQWFINLTATMPIKIKKIDASVIGGLDVGVKTPLVCAVSNSFARFSVQSNDVLKFSKQQFAFRRILLSKNSLKRRGHGSKNKLKPITKFTEKSNQYRKKIIEKWASDVTKFFVKNNVGIVQMEDLTTMREKEDQFFNQYLRGFWPYAQMQTMITNKLKEYGIKVKFVNPKYTSRLCSNPKCRHLNEYFSFEYRKENKFPLFKCEKCELEISPDYNAAKNLACLDIESVISESRGKKKHNHETAIA